MLVVGLQNAKTIAMEVATFAESILFGSSLPEKLISPGTFTDINRPSAGIAVPLNPARPPTLAFLEGVEKRRHTTTFPKRREMEEDEGRGRVMHFFANHELLALELMALMLLRFPDADANFRRTMCQTMLDEQRHLSLYLGRMQELGVDFGDVKVGRFFWDCLKNASSPLEFLAGMSLTFEQANLDFCRQYMADMAEIGDHETHRILETVYLDEIGHVAHGWDLFQDLRLAQDSEFSEYADLLVSPLTPRHGKGVKFFREPRERAGLSAQFITEIEVYSSSRGRMPKLFLFNPDCEGELLAPNQLPNNNVKQLERDLECLPAFLASVDDLVLVAKKPSVSFLAEMHYAGFDWPACTTMDELKSRILPMAEVVPWGRSTAVEKRTRGIEHLIPKTSAESGSCTDPTTIHRKSYAAQLAAELRFKSLDENVAECMSPVETCGRPAESLSEIEAMIEELRLFGYRNIVFKADLGASGRNMIRLLDEDLSPSNRAWLAAALSGHGCVIVEPWLDKVSDLSLHFNVNQNRRNAPELVAFKTDRRGQFRGAFVGRAEPFLDQSAQRWLNERFGRKSFLAVLNCLRDHVLDSLEADGYVGPVGVDMMIHRDLEGDLRLRPIVEINPRWTMGRVAMALRNRVARSRPAFFEIEGFKDNQSLKRVVNDRQSAHPLERSKGKAGTELREGYLSLVEMNDDRRFLASLWVGDAASERLNQI
ncbi:MAG: uncharacterized ferritin-like protein (DUF455 family) [Planctomycetota bacterium]|jgi:uncharacterized ferritin-like protein (DUF455 family)